MPMESAQRNSACSEPFKATKIWNTLVDHLKIRLEPRRRRWKLQIYEECFRGCDVMEELQNILFDHPELTSDPSRVHVKSLCQFLLENRVIECVCEDLKREPFENGRLYRFVNSSSSSNSDTISSVLSVEKSDRKKKRRSFDGWGLHSKSVRRKSYHGFRSRDKMVASAVKDDAEKENDEQQAELDDKRKRRLSFGGKDNLGFLSPWQRTPKKSKQQDTEELETHQETPTTTKIDVSGASFKEVWFEVTLSNLLKLLDISFLEPILQPASMKTSLSATVYNYSYNELRDSLTNSDKTGGRKGQDIIWQKAALDCFSAQSQFPLPRGDCGFQNITNLTEAEISNALAEFYGSLSDTLIPGSFMELVSGIIGLLECNRSVAAKALQLLMVLVPSDQREHLKRLLNFMEKTLTCRPGRSKRTRMRFVCRNFISGILPGKLSEQQATSNLIRLLITDHNQICTVPLELSNEVKRQVQSIQQGESEPIISRSSCQRITPLEYKHEGRVATQEGVRHLMNLVIDDLSLNLRTKEHKLAQFRKHHVDVFSQEFPSGIL
ncbi:predicted protein [Nematostella vectensis]|uniref:DEP domain-containing protein n=1 Tax=Nematostella vectensis TaxID=45351 RepID=A7RXU6_NEMVE|nr:predicted protein [Nematostella vectensis]|eukprot:XP_001635787.1 predicted protein [Nematostella vectensis]